MVRCQLLDVEAVQECAATRAAAKSTDRAVVRGRTTMVRDFTSANWDVRVVVDLILDGRSLTAALIAAGHGRAYDCSQRGIWYR